VFFVRCDRFHNGLMVLDTPAHQIPSPTANSMIILIKKRKKKKVKNFQKPVLVYNILKKLKKSKFW